MKKPGFKTAVAAIVALAMPASAAVFAAPASAASRASTNSPFVVDAVQALTGQLSAIGIAGEQAINAEAEILNEQGGVLGHKVVVHILDDGSSAQQSISATRQILANHPNVYIPDSPLAPEVLPFTTGVLTVSGCGDDICGDGSKWPDQFTVNATYTDQVSALLSYAHSQHFDKVGVLAQSGAEGQGFIQAAQQAAKAYGETIVASTSYSATESTYVPELQTLLSAGSQAIIGDLIGTTISTAMSSIQSLGTKVDVISDESAFVTNVDSSVPPAVQSQLVGVAFRWSARPAGGMQDAPPYIYKLYKLVNKEAGGNIFSFGVATSVAECLAEAAYAYEAAGSLNTQKAVSALDHISTAKNVPVDTFPFWYGVNPDYHGLVHNTQSADVGNNFFAVVHPGNFEDGTFLGTPFKYTVKR